VDEAEIQTPANPFAPYRRVGHALALIILAVCCVEFVRNWLQPSSRDFVSFWGAAKLALAGTPTLAYDRAALHAVQIKVAAFSGAAEMPFPYAPAFLLILLPFAAFPFPLAMVIWTFATLAIYAVAARRFVPEAGWLPLAFPAIFATAAIGQNGFLTAALFLGGLTLLRSDRRFAAGLMLGCLILKPQLALMLPVAMLAGREWRVIAGAIVSATTLMLIGVLAFGLATTSAWLGQMPLYARIARDGLVGWHKLISVYAAARQAGLPEQAAFALHAGVALAAAGLVAAIWRSKAEPMAKAAVLASATMLASPYVYLYDALILVPAFVWLVQRRTPVALVAALWLSPILIIVQTGEGSGPINVGALLPIALLGLIYAQWRKARSAPATVKAPANLAPVLGN
jgi:alpha-1,2-mannosyltransferase